MEIPCSRRVLFRTRRMCGRAYLRFYFHYAGRFGAPAVTVDSTADRHTYNPTYAEPDFRQGTICHFTPPFPLLPLGFFFVVVQSQRPWTYKRG